MQPTTGVTMRRLAVGFFLLSAAALGTMIIIRDRTAGTTVEACTEEAKLCPDGTAVGRMAPSCEFASCPGASEYTDPINNYRLTFPSTWAGYAMTTVATERYAYTAFTHPRRSADDGQSGRVEFSVVWTEDESSLPDGATLLERRSDTIFAAVKSQTATPGDLADRAAEIDGILESFVLLSTDGV